MNQGLDVWLLGIGAFACTLAGGGLALLLGRNIRFITGLSAGAVVGLALFDLIPEAAQLDPGPGRFQAIMVAVSAGFCLYMAAHRVLHRVSGVVASNHLGAASLTLHSFFDGLGIGLAFKVSPGVGSAVAIAVLAHDLCDGVNTVAVALNGRLQGRFVALRWLAVNAAAPLLGIAVAAVVPVGATTLAPLAAGFAGVFLYIGAVELLPKSFACWRSPLASLPVMSGVAAIYLVVNLLHRGA